jgi:hypothetical protein
LVNANFNISELVSNPDKIGSEEAEILQQKIQDNPWCSSFYTLLAKAHFNSDSFLKNKHLKQAAMYVGEREMLFNIIHKSQPITSKQESVSVNIPEAIELEPEVEEVVVQDKEAIELVTEEVETVKVDEKQDLELPNTTEIVEEESIKEEIVVENTIVEEEHIEAEGEKVTEVESSLIDTPSEESKIDFEKIVQYDPIKELKVEAKEPEEEIIEIPFDTVVYNPEVELNKIIEEKEEVESGDDKDFMYWLNHVGDDDESQPKSQPKEKSPDKVQGLLDEFLATKRKKPIQTREFYSAQNKAKESETDHMEVVTETLIKIYENQQLYEKAIEGYQKLSLQNPSKTAYFAARITELKEKQAHSI